jgi:hypothetical protein
MQMARSLSYSRWICSVALDLLASYLRNIVDEWEELTKDSVVYMADVEVARKYARRVLARDVLMKLHEAGAISDRRRVTRGKR